VHFPRTYLLAQPKADLYAPLGSQPPKIKNDLLFDNRISVFPAPDQKP
jgi:hypothetical protein